MRISNCTIEHVKNSNFPMPQRGFGNLAFPGRRCEFGSSDALDIWLKNLQEDRGNSGRESWDSLDLYRVDSGVRWEEFIARPIIKSPSPDNFNILDRSTDAEIECICCSCTDGGHEMFPPCDEGIYTSKSNLLMMWSQAKYRESDFYKRQSTSIIPHHEEEEISSTASTVTSTPPPTRLSFEAPLYKAPSKNCAICNSPLLSARAVLSPPGYCEYTGDLICGACFEPRQIVIPYKVLEREFVHFDSIRGNVSKESAKLIQSLFYDVSIHYSEIQNSERIKIAHSLRMRFMTFFPVFESCSIARMQISDISRPLPDHIRSPDRDDPQQLLLYCLADIVDIVGGGRGPSVIITTLNRMVGILNFHSCPECMHAFSRICPVCTKFVRQKIDIEWTECQFCLTSFHRICLARCVGCPTCTGT